LLTPVFVFSVDTYAVSQLSACFASHSHHQVLIASSSQRQRFIGSLRVCRDHTHRCLCIVYVTCILFRSTPGCTDRPCERRRHSRFIAHQVNPVTRTCSLGCDPAVDCTNWVDVYDRLPYHCSTRVTHATGGGNGLITGHCVNVGRINRCASHARFTAALPHNPVTAATCMDRKIIVIIIVNINIDIISNNTSSYSNSNRNKNISTINQYPFD
jgi:hypothetical protein